MAREMTPRERAAAVLDQMVVNMPPRDARHYNEQVIENALRHARCAALLECANKVKDRAALWRSHGGAKIGFPYGHLTVEDECDSIADELHRLAQEG